MAVLLERPIRIEVGDDADVDVLLRTRKANGDGSHTFTPYTLPTGSSVKLYVKRNQRDPDTAALFTLESPAGLEIVDTGEDTTDKASRVRILWSSSASALSQLARIQTLRYKLVATRSGRKQTVMKGPLVIEP